MRRLRTADQSDAALVGLALAGDPDGFALLFRRHAPAVIAFARRRSGSESLADDITATTFEKAWRRLDTIADAGDGFRPWVFRIAANEMASRYRSDARRSGREQRTADRAVDAVSQPEATALATVDAERVRHAVERLKPAHHEVIALRFFADLTTGEVAEALQMTPGAVAVRLHRALRELQAVLADGDADHSSRTNEPGADR